MTGETSAALASPIWPWVVLVLGLVAAALIFRQRSSIAALWRSHQETREADGERSRDGGPAKSDRDRITSGLDLDALEVSDIMVHRTAMRALNAGDPPEEIVKAVLESPYTRMPLWAGSVDNIVGVVHAKDLLRALAEPGVEPRNLDITRVAQKPWFVPDTTTLKEQLAAFLRRQEHFATVVDEYGEVQGVVTLQDILKEIVARRGDGTLVIGFAAETENVLANGRAKLERKGVDALVVNDVSGTATGFDSDSNGGTFLTAEGAVDLPLGSKAAMAAKIFNQVAALRLRTAKV